MTLVLSRDEIEELDALSKTNEAIGKSFLARKHWHESGYAKFARRGLVSWGEPPDGFNRRRFAGVEITTAGRAELAALSKGR